MGEVVNRPHAAAPAGHPRAWRFLVGSTVLLGIVAAALVLAGRQVRIDREQAERWERHTLAVQAELKNAMAALLEAETGQRGYLLTGDADYLAPYQAGHAAIDGALYRLSMLTSDNPTQHDRVAELQRLARAKLEELSTSLTLYRSGNTRAAIELIETGRGRSLMSAAQALAASILAEENRLLVARESHTAGLRYQEKLLLSALAALIALTLLGTGAALLSAVRNAERVRLLAQVGEREALYRATFESAAVGIAHVTLEGRFARINARVSQLLGYTPEELAGLTFQEVTHPEDLDGDLERVRALLEGTVDSYTLEKRYRRKDGGVVWANLTVALVRDASGAPRHFVSVLDDISARKRAQEALAESEERFRRLAAELRDARDALAGTNAQLEARVAERTAHLDAARRRLETEIKERVAAESQVRQLQKMEAIGQLTGGIAHDFNNMLAIIIGSLDLARRRLQEGDLGRVRACIETAEEGARRAAQLTARLLSFSRLAPLAPQPVDANKLVGGMSELLQRTIGEEIRLETVLAGGLWRAFIDPGQLENAILNLCVNARDAMPDGGRMTIETANAYLDESYAEEHLDVTPGQFVLIAVTDTGVGMTADVMERAFDPFYTTKGAGKGTGLGLSQVYGFVKQSGGHVKIYSEPGAGTSVKLYVPRHRGEAVEETATAASVQGPPPRAVEGEVVLLVEDEPAVRQVSADALRELGYVVLSAADGAQALAQLELAQRVDLLFTDIVMPDMNGRRLAEAARRLRPDLKVLYTTGYTRNAVVHHGVLDPGVAFLGKPFTLEELARKVRAVLAGGGANRA